MLLNISINQYLCFSFNQSLSTYAKYAFHSINQSVLMLFIQSINKFSCLNSSRLYLEDLVGPEYVAALQLIDAALVVVLELLVRVNLE